LAVAIGPDLPESATLDLAARLAVAAERTASDVFCDGIDADGLALVASSILVIASLDRVGPSHVLTAQFPATLRTLLELVVSDFTAIDESEGLLLEALANASTHRYQRFKQETSARRTRQQQELEREAGQQANELTQILESQAGPGVKSLEPPVLPPSATTGRAAFEFPRSWLPGAQGEWRDPTRAQDLAKRSVHRTIGYPAFVLLGKGTEARIQCILRWGHGDLAVEIRSQPRDTDGEAFEEALHWLSLCPDEKPRNWFAAVTEAVPDLVPPPMVTMRNVAPVGPPRYVCTAIWSAKPKEVQVRVSSTARQTMSDALAELVQRLHERAHSFRPAHKVSTQELLKGCGLLNPRVEFERSPRGQVALLYWTGLDGVRRTATSQQKPSTARALEDAISSAQKLEDSYAVDWVMAARRLFARVAPVAAAHFVEEPSANAGASARIRCVVRLDDGTILRGPVAKTRRSALLAAVEEVRERHALQSLAKDALSPTTAPGERRVKVFQVLTHHKDAWVQERAALMALEARSVAQETRLRDVTALLALADPVRRNEVDARVAVHLIEDVLQFTATGLQHAKQGPSEQRLVSYLKSMLQDGVSPGAELQPGDALAEECSQDGITADEALEWLFTARLANRKGEGGPTLSEQGARLLARRPQSGSTALALSLRKAQART
jgi:hypothetical protein